MSEQIATIPAPIQPESKPKQIKRRITLGDIEAMVELMAKRITETGACHILGIKPQVWFNFKCRGNNAVKLDDILSRARETQIKAHLENIEDAEHGKNGHRPDWRASLALLQVKAPERYSINKPDPAQTNNTLVLVQAGGEEGLKRIIAQYASAGQASTVSALPKASDSVQLCDTKQDNNSKPDAIDVQTC